MESMPPLVTPLVQQGFQPRQLIIRGLRSRLTLSRRDQSAAGASDALLIFQGPLAHQGEEGLEAGSVAGAGLELHSGGKQSASIEASSCLPLAFSCLSRSVSLSICSISFSSCFIRHSCCILRRS